MKFRDYFSLKHILFAAALLLIMMLFAIRQSNNMVKVYFEDTQLEIVSSKYTMTVGYDEILSAELVTAPDPGEKRDEDAWDDDLIRTGNWKNEAWGEYCVCADLDPTNCIVLHLDDGSTYVFSRKSNATNQELYEKLQEHLQK